MPAVTERQATAVRRWLRERWLMFRLTGGTDRRAAPPHRRGPACRPLRKGRRRRFGGGFGRDRSCSASPGGQLVERRRPIGEAQHAGRYGNAGDGGSAEASGVIALVQPHAEPRP